MKVASMSYSWQTIIQSLQPKRGRRHLWEVWTADRKFDLFQTFLVYVKASRFSHSQTCGRFTSMTDQIVQIANRATHDKIIADSATKPTVLYLSSSPLPACKTFTPQYAALAKEFDDVKFCQMEHNSETSPMFKFSQAQLPNVILIVEGKWCRTLLSPTVKEVEAGIEELISKAG